LIAETWKKYSHFQSEENMKERADVQRVETSAGAFIDAAGAIIKNVGDGSNEHDVVNISIAGGMVAGSLDSAKIYATDQDAALNTSLTGFITDQDAALNTSLRGFVTNQDEALHDNLTIQIDALNTSLSNFVTAQDEATLSLAEAYSTDQDAALSSSLTGFITDQDAAILSAAGLYATDQNAALNTALRTFITDQDAALQSDVPSIVFDNLTSQAQSIPDLTVQNLTLQTNLTDQAEILGSVNTVTTTLADIVNRLEAAMKLTGASL
jgi:hypothetical protein